MNLSDAEHHINKRQIHSYALTPNEEKGNGNSYNATKSVNDKYSPEMRDSMTLIAGLQMGAPNGLEEIYEAVKKNGGFKRAATEIEYHNGWDKRSPFKELYALEAAWLFTLSYKEVQAVVKELAIEKNLNIAHFAAEVPSVSPATPAPSAPILKSTNNPYIAPVEETAPEPEKPPFRDAIKQGDAPPQGSPAAIDAANTAATEPEKPKIGFIKPIVAILTGGIAAFAGDSKQPEGMNNPNAPKGNWFQRNYKNVLRVLAGLTCLDMVQAMVRGTQPIIGQATERLFNTRNSARSKAPAFPT